MEITPVILSNVVFDTQTGTLHTETQPPYPLLRISGHPVDIAPAFNPPEADTLYITRPTYAMPYFHYCFGHAYVDTCIPLLSILHEYDSECLGSRGFQLFFLKELNSDVQWLHQIAPTSSIKDYFQRWEAKTVDYNSGTLKGAYQIFHHVCSDAPILFERAPPPQRYIHFSTFLYGGNEDNQRCIHNSSARYPHRRNGHPLATDEQILRWVNQGKAAMSRFLNLYPPSPDPTPPLFLARKDTRAFDEASIEILTDMLETEPVYFEDIPFKDQIETIRNAKTIVAAHGSGLCHLIWCQPGTHLIEIFATDDSRKGIFESFCAFLGIRYTRIECSNEKGESDAPIHISSGAFSQIYSALRPSQPSA